MNVAVCFNRVPPRPHRGEAGDRISEEGAETEALAVCGALRELGHAPALVPLGPDPISFLADLRRRSPDAVFNLCEGVWGDSRKEMHAAALLDLLGIPFTGSPPLCLGLTQDKVRTKDLLAAHFIPTPGYLSVDPGEEIPRGKPLSWPLIVKPRGEDASLGITNDSIVENVGELKRRVLYIHETYRQGALVEEFIEGREINAAVLGDTSPAVLPLSEICFRPGLTRPIVSYEGKWLEDSLEYLGTEPVCPAPVGEKEGGLLRKIALRACRIAGCRDYARVDIRLREGVPYVLEVNANPDISPGAGLARSAQAAGISYPELVGRILAMAVGRKENERAQP